MGVWDHLASLLFSLLDRYDDLMVFVLVLIEEAGVPLPLPGDLVMVVAGLRIANGRMSLAGTLLLLELATMLGASLLYWLAARGGRPLLLRYGRYIHLDHNRLDRAERWVTRRGALAVIAGRIIPGLRIPTAVAAGVFGIRYPVFISALTVGSFIYICFWVGVGYFFGPEALATLHAVRLPLRALLSLMLFIGLGAFLFVVYRRSRRVRHLSRVPATEPRRLEMAVLAGFVATLEMGLGTNAVVYLFSLLGLREPEREIVELATLGADRFFDGDLLKFAVALTALLFVGGCAWAILYTHVVEPLLPWPAWLGGLAFGLCPWLVSMLVLLPLFGGGIFGLALDAGPIPLIGEAVRTGLFGLGLGTSYALLYAARQPPTRAVSSPREPDSAGTL
jgi:membrane protein DedA with SNARE-associated domain